MLIGRTAISRSELKIKERSLEEILRAGVQAHYAREDNFTPAI
jgi:hypothetical protein